MDRVKQLLAPSRSGLDIRWPSGDAFDCKILRFKQIYHVWLPHVLHSVGAALTEWRSRPADHPQRLRLDQAVPWIVAAARKNRITQFVIGGEAFILGVDGISHFDALHSGKRGHEVQLYAFDVLAMDGDDLRELPLSMRKASLARLLRGRPDGMFITPSNRGRSGRTCFGRPASSGSKA
jgi:hypothetical protein